MALTNIHYDITPDFFAQFLDPYLKYTSGLFDGEEPLQVGITRMLDKHLEFLNRYNNPKILDVGPGWGALLCRLQESAYASKATYTAINPSKSQNAYLLSRAVIPVTVLETTFEDTDLPDNLFDCVYLIGSLCHLRDKPKQMVKLFAILRPGGRIIIEDTFFISQESYQKHCDRNETRFVQNTMFGFAEILSLPSYLSIAANVGFQIQSLLEHSSSYSRTIELWLQKLNTIKQGDGAPIADGFIKYLRIAQRGWQRTIANYLIELKKVNTR